MVERDPADRIYPLSTGSDAVRMNNAEEMAVLAGQGAAHETTTIMALGLDMRFALVPCLLDRRRHRWRIA